MYVCIWLCIWVSVQLLFFYSCSQRVKKAYWPTFYFFPIKDNESKRTWVVAETNNYEAPRSKRLGIVILIYNLLHDNDKSNNLIVIILTDDNLNWHKIKTKLKDKLITLTRIIITVREKIGGRTIVLIWDLRHPFWKVIGSPLFYPRFSANHGPPFRTQEWFVTGRCESEACSLTKPGGGAPLSATRRSITASPHWEGRRGEKCEGM